MSETQFVPTPGRIVEYTLSEQDAQQINKRRDDANKSGICQQQTGAVVHFGNRVSAGEKYPMVIIRVWSTESGCCNGQVLLDGVDTLWATSVVPGEGERQFRPFPRV